MSERDARIAEIRPCQWNCLACGREMISSGVDMDVFEAVLHRAEAAEAKLAAQDAEIVNALRQRDEARATVHACDDAACGIEPSDFMQSFPTVRRVVDLWVRVQAGDRREP